MINNKTGLAKLMASRNKLLNDLQKKLEAAATQAGEVMYDEIINRVIDKLDKDENGNIRNNMYNKRLISSIDLAFSSYYTSEGIGLASEIASGAMQVVNFQSGYYSNFTTQASLLPIKPLVMETVQTWLGIGEKGRLEKNGYLVKIAQAAEVKQAVRDITLKGIVGGQGWQDTKFAIKDYIKGNPQSNPFDWLNKYTRNFVYDTYAQIDRTTGRMFADKLGFQFAVFEGGIIKTTREWCNERNGKVFHISEIERFDPGKSMQPNYNPVTDLGGWGCRHHLNWIPDSLAVILRPDAQKFLQAA